MDRGQGRPEAYFWLIVCFFLFFINSTSVLKASAKGAKQQELAQNLARLTQALRALSGEEEQEEAKALKIKKLRYENTLLKSQKLTPTEWEKKPISERAKYLVNQFDRKEQGLKLDMKPEELQEKYVETASLMVVDTAASLTKAIRQAVGITVQIEGFAWALLLAINAVKVMSSKDYLARIDELNRLTACINLSDEKLAASKACAASNCVSMQTCVATLLGDIQYLLMPVVSLTITGTKIGGKRVQGFFPLVFVVFAPKAQITKNITELSDTLYLFMELLGQIQTLILMQEKTQGSKGLLKKVPITKL